MMPPIYTWLAAVPAITGIVGTNIFGSGAATEAAGELPTDYIVFQCVAKESPIYLGADQDVDYDRVQIHCWSLDESRAAALATLCRAALNPHGNLVGGFIADRDPETKHYRCGFDFGGWSDIT
jgi:hypothetical protein